MMHAHMLALVCLAAVNAAPALAQLALPRTSDGRPDFQGVRPCALSTHEARTRDDTRWRFSQV